jgi:hypothetical protein
VPPFGPGGIHFYDNYPKTLAQLSRVAVPDFAKTLILNPTAPWLFIPNRRFLGFLAWDSSATGRYLPPRIDKTEIPAAWFPILPSVGGSRQSWRFVAPGILRARCAGVATVSNHGVLARVDKFRDRLVPVAEATCSCLGLASRVVKPGSAPCRCRTRCM